MLRGHELLSAVPEDAVRCEYCAGVWSLLDLFRGRIPRSRRHTQRAYDDPVYQRPVGIMGS